jgi:multiple sugar transport system substrate-binding protein
MGMTATLTGAIGLSATTTACGGSGGGGELRMLASDFAAGDGGAERYWNEMIEAFHAAHPDIRVEVTLVPVGEAYQEATRLVEAGEAPDIAQLSSFADFAHAEQLYSASEILNVPVQADFVPAVAAAGEVRRVQYGMPAAAVLQRLVYNTALFDQAGLDPDSPPRSWNELATAAQALRTAGVPIPFGLPFGHDQAYVEAAMWILAGGGHLTDAAGTYAIESDLNTETFTWLRDNLVDQSLTGDARPSETSREDLYAEFVAGRVGMLTADPALMGLCEEAGTDYATGPMPGRRGPSLSTVGEAAWLLAFNQRGNREQISTFLNWAFSDGYQELSGFAEENQLLPISSPTAQAMSVSDSPGHRRLRPYLEELPNATFLPAGKLSWTTVAAFIAAAIGDTLRTGGDVRQVLAELQTSADAVERA